MFGINKKHDLINISDELLSEYALEIGAIAVATKNFTVEFEKLSVGTKAYVEGRAYYVNCLNSVLKRMGFGSTMSAINRTNALAINYITKIQMHMNTLIMADKELCDSIDTANEEADKLMDSLECNCDSHEEAREEKKKKSA